jgi:tRNA(adenine34) deaminase
MSVALEHAMAAEAAGEVPVGAVIVVDNEIVGVGCNGPIALSDPTAHAEILAVRQACDRIGNYRIPRATAFVTLEPCAMCAGAFIHARIERLVYAAADPKSGACGSIMNVAQDSRLNHSIEVTRGVMEAESAELLRRFFRARRQQQANGGS